MRTSRHAVILVIGLLAASLPAAASASIGLDEAVLAEAAASHGDGFEEVARIEGPGGTDLEFFSRSLTEYRTADGSVITADAPVDRHFAMVGNQQSGAKIIDITDPERPFVAGAVQDCTVGQGDVQVTADGTLAAIAWQTSGTCETEAGKRLRPGSVLVDLTDPYDPIVVGGAPDGDGAHNNTLHPSGGYLYISTSGIEEVAARVPIYDIKDPANPRLVQVWTAPGNSPHDVRFSADGTRAYMAGISQYRIVDTTDPESPSVISVIVPPGGTIGHDTLVTPDGAFLFLGDEGGGGAPYPCPGGAIYVYDIRMEATPLLLGAAEAGVGPVTNRQYDEAAPGGVGGCTAHVMALNPDNQSLTLGWYTAGSRVFDFSALYNDDGTPNVGPAVAYGDNGLGIVETGYIVPDGANTWSAKQYAEVPGYIFSDDLNLGFYVTKIPTD